MENLQVLVENLKVDNCSVQLIADYLGYEVGANPVEENDEWKILFTDKLDEKTSGVLALKVENELSMSSKTIEVRRLYKQVEELKKDFSIDFDVQVAGFVGDNRLILFPVHNGNRDVRLDINLDTANKRFYETNFNLLKNQNITVEEDEFGFGSTIMIPNGVFTQQLSTHFLSVVAYYRKKLSELITSTSIKDKLKPLVGDKAKFYLSTKDLINLVEDETYIAVLSNVVDTIILRQLMRRFLEGYYGPDAFNVRGIALGVAEGTLDDAIKKVVEAEATIQVGDEDAFKKLNRKQKPIEVYEEFTLDLFFDEDEIEATTQLNLIPNSKSKISELTENATKQFRSVYDGDLFAGSIGQVADQVEQILAKDYTEVWTKLWLDTSAQEYSFRYEDLPPNAIEKQYENSMSQNVQIKIDEDNTPIVYYGEDIVEQKNKGAYYTDERFVSYMVKQTVEVEFSKRFDALKEALSGQNNTEIESTIRYLLDMKVADLSSGGGSFLRGAFQLLSSKHGLLTTLNIPSDLSKKYPFFENTDESVYQWENHILEKMIYGVDIDYKAIIISSLTLTLSSIEHRNSDTKLPSLIGRNLIHQNSLINTVPYFRREEVYAEYQEAIKELRYLKLNDFSKYQEKRQALQTELLQFLPEKLRTESSFLNIEAIEINLPEVFFDEEGVLIKDGGFDVVIGNPPWEIWKPNSDEFFSQYDDNYLALSTNKRKKARQAELFDTMPRIEKKWQEEVNRIEQGSEYFRNRKNFQYQSWKVEGRKTGSDINLYKISIERFLQLLKPNQHLSLIVPDNLMTDLGSTGLRHLIFEKFQLEEFLSFENRKGIFETIHRSYKFAVTTVKTSPSDRETFKAFFYKTDLNLLNQEAEKMDYPFSLVKEAEPEKYSLFEPRDEKEFNLYRKIKLKFAPLRETNIFSLRRDFDRTNDTSLFDDLDKKDYPLYEGKLMNQFTLVGHPEEGVSKEDIVRKTGEDYKYFRIGIRAVARETDRRALITTLLPRFSTAANSLLMQRDVNDSMIESQLFTLGYLNSYTLDFVLRKLITMNVNQTYLKQLPIPRLSDIENPEDIIQIVKRLLLENGSSYEELNTMVVGDAFANLSHNELIAELNARVAISFDLTREEVINLMKSFETANHKKFVQEESQRIINVYDRIKNHGK